MKSSQEKIFLLITVLFLASALSRGTKAQSPAAETTTAPTTGTITGRVLSETGQPLPNATVVVRASYYTTPPRTTQTDSEGNFQVGNLDAQLYLVTAALASYVSPPRDIETPQTNYRIGESVALTLIKGGVITGTVTSAEGEPLVQVAVRVTLIRDANGQPPRSAANTQLRLTDDRGVYRIYGLLPGTYVVLAGGRSFSSNGFGGAYDADAPTYATSSTRDNADEVTVRAGEETSGVHIRYRGETGHSISGFVTGPAELQYGINLVLSQVVNGVRFPASSATQFPNAKGFSIQGLADGDYDLNAQASLAPGEYLMVEPRRIKVKGRDVTGVALTLKPLGSVIGRVNFEPSMAVECKNKRRPSLAEMVVTARLSERSISQNEARLPGMYGGVSPPDKSGDFQLRNLGAGQFGLDARFFAKYWYLRSISRAAPPTAPISNRGAPAKVGPIDLARNGLSLKFGERVDGVTVTLAEGAASLRGTIKPAEGDNLAPNVYVHLLPAEKENAEDLLRVFATRVNSDRTFAFNNLPPGRYRLVAQSSAVTTVSLQSKLREPAEIELRGQLQRAAEVANVAIELKPCQNLTDYLLLYKP